MGKTSSADNIFTFILQVCNTSPTEDHTQDQNVDMENAQDVKDDVNDISNVLQESKIKKDIDNDDDIGATNSKSQDLIVSA